jgi:hypothetical protein
VWGDREGLGRSGGWVDWGGDRGGCKVGSAHPTLLLRVLVQSIQR